MYIHEKITWLRAKPEFLWPDQRCSGSPLPDGRVDFRGMLSGYIYSGFAISGQQSALENEQGLGSSGLQGKGRAPCVFGSPLLAPREGRKEAKPKRAKRASGDWLADD